MVVVGEAANGDEAFKISIALHPTLALIDIAMPVSGGIPAIAKIVRCCNDTEVLALSAHDDPMFVRAALDAGAHGYILKKAEPTTLLLAIRSLCKGHTFLDPLLSDLAIQGIRRIPASHAVRGTDVLSPREKEVLILLAEGYTPSQIARELLITAKTVETYRARICEKVGSHARSDMYRYAAANDLLRTIA